MKVCPVCKSNVFDDMQTCFNCLHKFDDKKDLFGDTSGFDKMTTIEKTQVLEPVKALTKSQSQSEQPFVVCQADNNFLESYYAFLGNYLKNKKEVV